MKSKLVDYKQELSTVTTHYSTLDNNHHFFHIDNEERKANTTQAVVKISKILSKKVLNKKRYSFQILKQFILFLDSSYTESIISVSKYDPILFSDEKIHTVFKILQTQLIERNIWAFINLRAHIVQSKVNELVCVSEQASQKVQTYFKIQSFYLIQKVSEAKKKHSRVLHSENIINISINNTPEKKYKFQRSFNNEDKHQRKVTLASQYNQKGRKKTIDLEYTERSKKTIAETQYNQGSKKSIYTEQFQQRPVYQASLKEITCHSCNSYRNYCCCYVSYASNHKATYNIEERIQYLQRLEEIYNKTNRFP